MSHLCWSTTLSTSAIITAISCYRAVSVSLNEPLRVLGRTGSGSIKKWRLVNARDWPYSNCSTDSSLIYLCWADFISVPAWMAFTGSFPFNKEKKEETVTFSRSLQRWNKFPLTYCYWALLFNGERTSCDVVLCMHLYCTY